MAILKHISSIHDDIRGAMRYIQNPEKNLPGEQVAAVMRYIVSHSVEQVMSLGYHGCCGVSDFDMHVFSSARAAYMRHHKGYDTNEQVFTVERYLKSHKTKLYQALKEQADREGWSEQVFQERLRKAVPPRLKVDADGMIHTTKQEVVAEHLTISMHMQDDPSPAVLRAVLNEFVEHPYLAGIPILANMHWDTPSHRHAHLLLFNFASDGSRKLCLSGRMRLELQRHLDRICYRHGLSIIDARPVRQDKTHADWIDKVKAEGKVTVWPAKVQGNALDWAQKDGRASLPEEYAGALVEWLNDLSPHFIGYPGYLQPTRPSAPRRPGSAETGNKQKHHQQSYYSVPMRRYNKKTHRYEEPSLLELVFGLAQLIITGETKVLEEYFPDQQIQEADFGKPDLKIQAIMDSLAISRKYGCRSPADLDQRVDTVRHIIRSTRKEIDRDTYILSQPELVEACAMWANTIAPKESRATACATLAAYGYQTHEQRTALYRRLINAKQRLTMNLDYLADLKKDRAALEKAVTTLKALQIDVERYQYAAQEALQTADVHPAHDAASDDLQKPKKTPLDTIIRQARKNHSQQVQEKASSRPKEKDLDR